MPFPHHIAIIMDGNGRWAKSRGLPRISGHQAGANAIREIVRTCAEKKIEMLTLWAFSTENWARPEKEVSFLMDLMYKTLEKEVKTLHKNNIRFRSIGDRSKLPVKLQDVINRSEALTVNNTGLTLVIAINYSGRWDIKQAMGKIAEKVRSGLIAPDSINDETIRAELCLSDFPDPDLFIRTGGEIRISNYFLWQLAYTELYFTEAYWPDFNAEELEKALTEYANRERRFGKISEQL